MIWQPEVRRWRMPRPRFHGRHETCRSALARESFPTAPNASPDTAPSRASALLQKIASSSPLMARRWDVRRWRMPRSIPQAPRKTCRSALARESILAAPNVSPDTAPSRASALLQIIASSSLSMARRQEVRRRMPLSQGRHETCRSALARESFPTAPNVSPDTAPSRARVRLQKTVFHQQQ